MNVIEEKPCGSEPRPDLRGRIPVLQQFRTRLIVLVLLPMLPMLALAFYTSIEQRRATESRMREKAASLADLVAATEEKFVKNTRQLLATLAEFPFLVLTTNRAFCEQHFDNLRKLSPDYLDFGIIELNGDLFCSAGAKNRRTSLADRSHFQRVRDTGRFSIGDYQAPLLTERPALDFGHPILDPDGRLARVLYASLRLELLSDLVAQVRLPPGTITTIFDGRGTVVARFPDPEQWVAKPADHMPMFPPVSAGVGAVFQTRGLDDVSRLYAVSSLSDDAGQKLFVAIGIPLEASLAAANAALRRSLIVCGVVVLLALLSTHLYARRSLIDPVNALASTAERLAAGDTGARSGLAPGKGELSKLAGAFDSMAARLEQRAAEVEQAQSEIGRINAELEQRVRERTAQLEGANRELEAFSYSVSHDLRAPLRHISGFADLLKRSLGPGPDPKHARYVGLIEQSAREMGALIDDLLSFSRMARTEMRAGTVDSRRQVAAVIDDLNDQTTGRVVEWAVGELPAVQGDEAMLRQVWVNLLSNALKYSRTRESARVEVGCEYENSIERVFSVRDNGVGFDMKYADKLFGVFQRLHDPSEFEGTGIGLATVRRIVTRHGGRTWAEGTVDQGAAFYFSLPKSVLSS